MNTDYKQYFEYANYQLKSLVKNNLELFTNRKINETNNIISTGYKPFLNTFFYMDQYKITHYRRLVSFLSLHDNWDGYGGSKISQKTIMNSIVILLGSSKTVYRVSPSPNESVLLIWKNNNLKLLLEIADLSFNYAIINTTNNTGDEYRDLPFNRDSINEIVESIYV